MVTAPYPIARFRRTKRSENLRRMVRETTLSTADLIWPVFLTEGEDREDPIPSMPGVARMTIDRVVGAARAAEAQGIPAMCLFPYIDTALKTEACEEAWNPDNLSNRATRAIKAAVPGMVVMTDVALDPYNILGQDGIVRDGVVVNDESVAALVRMAIEQARAGADVLGPSDMMDGRIGAIRAALEAEGLKDTAIMSYAAKYASSFYGPFRDAVGASGLLKGDKKTYQMDPGNTDEAMRLIERDLLEGADMVMVKPGMPYLDICRRASERFNAPLFAYQVSGEYAMIRGAADRGWIDGERAMMESLIAFKRAGCDGILTYFAPEAARILNGD